LKSIELKQLASAKTQELIASDATIPGQIENIRLDALEVVKAVCEAHGVVIDQVDVDQLHLSGEYAFDWISLESAFTEKFKDNFPFLQLAFDRICE
jgi:hypothetical protein